MAKIKGTKNRDKKLQWIQYQNAALKRDKDKMAKISAEVSKSFLFKVQKNYYYLFSTENNNEQCS